MWLVPYWINDIIIYYITTMTVAFKATETLRVKIKYHSDIFGCKLKSSMCARVRARSHQPTMIMFVTFHCCCHFFLVACKVRLFFTLTWKKKTDPAKFHYENCAPFFYTNTKYDTKLKAGKKYTRTYLDLNIRLSDQLWRKMVRPLENIALNSTKPNCLFRICGAILSMVFPAIHWSFAVHHRTHLNRS